MKLSDWQRDDHPLELYSKLFDIPLEDAIYRGYIDEGDELGSIVFGFEASLVIGNNRINLCVCRDDYAIEDEVYKEVYEDSKEEAIERAFKAFKEAFPNYVEVD